MSAEHSRPKQTECERIPSNGNPVVSIIRSHSEELSAINKRLLPISDPNKQGELLAGELGFLADKFETVDFSLTPSDLTTIWAEAIRHFPARLQRYSLARMLSCAYSIKGVHNSGDWEGFPRHFLEHSQIPPDASKNIIGLIYVQNKLSGIYGSATSLAVAEDRSNVLGNSNEQIVNEVRENFINGITPILGRIQTSARRNGDGKKS